jgi:hypothetical protein
MSEAIKNKILKALFVAIKPIAKSLIRSGIGYKEFSDIAKSAFVEVATDDYGLRGRPTNISRVAIMTGIARKEVGKIRDRNLDLVAEISIRESPMSVLLHRWSSAPEYIDEDGKPKDLQYEGENSFVSLVSACIGDIPPGAIRTELARAGCISESDSKLIRLEKRTFIPSGIDERLVLGLESSIHSLSDTVAFNCDPERTRKPKFQRLASVDGIPADRLPGIQEVASNRLHKFCEEFDGYLSLEEDKVRGEPDSGIQVGIGLYYYELYPPNSKGKN